MEAALQRHARLIEDARTWLPTGDAAAHGSIVAWLALAARTGVDPIAGLRAALSRWFGSAAGDLLQPQTVTALTTPSAPELVALETLSSLRRPTLWPQRPKRFAGELFSSWLWRASVAAGAPPRRFAAEALAAAYADPDTEVSDATLHRLALLSGQPVSCLAAATLTVAHPVTRADAVLDALLRHGGFLLCAESRADRPRAVLQYCPRCLAADPPALFPARLAVLHPGRLRAPSVPSVRSLLALQRAGRAARPDDRLPPTTLRALRGAPGRCSGRTSARRGAPPARSDLCLVLRGGLSRAGGGAPSPRCPGRPVCVGQPRDGASHGRRAPSPRRTRALVRTGRRPAHRGLIQQHARGRAYNAWFGYAGTQQSSEHQDVPPPGRLPLSRRRRPQPSWFAARRPGRHRTRG